MVHRMPATAFLVLLQQRKVHHPQGFEDVRIAQVKQVSPRCRRSSFSCLRVLSAPPAMMQSIDRLVACRSVRPISADVPANRTCPQCSSILLPPFHEYDPRGTDLWTFHEIDQRIGLLAAPVRTAFGLDTDNQFSIIEDLEADSSLSLHRGRSVSWINFIPKRKIRLIATVHRAWHHHSSCAGKAR
jgi:hypothetical protein